VGIPIQQGKGIRGGTIAMRKRTLVLAVGLVTLSCHVALGELQWSLNGTRVTELYLPVGETITLQLYNDDDAAFDYDVLIPDDAPGIADITSVTPLSLAGELAWANYTNPNWWLHAEWQRPIIVMVVARGYHWNVTLEGVSEGTHTFPSGTVGPYSNLTVTVGPPCACVPPVLTQAVSRRTHGSAGEFDIDVGAGDTECRSPQLGTITANTVKIIAQFDRDIALLNGWADVTIDNGYMDGVTQIGPRSLEIDLYNLGDRGDPSLSTFATEVNLGFGGVVPAIFPAPDYACESTLCVRIIVGDYNNDGRTNFMDFSEIKNNNWLNQIPIGGLMPRADFDCSGRISFLDFSKAKNAGLINKAAPPCP
jgi:hypothetical protein